MTSKQIVISRLKRGAIEVLLLRILGVGMLFFMHTALGRMLGREGYGTLIYALALAGLLSMIVPLGFPAALMRFVTQYREQKEWRLLKGAFIRSHQVVTISSLFVSLILWGITCLDRPTYSMALSLRYAALMLPLLVFMGIRRNALIGLRSVKSAIIPDDIVLPLLVIVGLYSFAISKVSNALLLYAVMAFVAFLLGSILLWRGTPGQVRSVKADFQTREWIASALPMLFGRIGQIVLNRTDVLMLGIMVNMDSVGLYSAAGRIALLNVIILNAVNTIATPLIGAAFHGNRVEEFKLVIRKTILLSAAGALPLFIVMFLGSKKILYVFGSNFEEGYILLQILALGQFANAITGPVGIVLIMTGGERQFAFSMCIVAAMNVLGNYVAIRAFGVIGAACFTTFSVILINIWQFALMTSVCRSFEEKMAARAELTG